MDRIAQHRQEQQYRRELDEPVMVETDIGAVLEPTRPSKPCDTPIRPGSWYAGQAFKNGTEDDYIDQMKNRYGGEW